MTSTITPPRSDTPPSADREVRGVPPLLRPFVDFVARIQARLHTKLLAAFLGISLIMLSLGIVGLVVVNRMGSEVDRLWMLQHQSDNARHMLYTITAQSHFRTMQFLTGFDDWQVRITNAKADFAALIDDTEAIAIGDFEEDLFDDLRAINVRYAAAGAGVESLLAEGNEDAAKDLYVGSEYEISHELEALLTRFIGDSGGEVQRGFGDFVDDRQFLSSAMALFSGVSLLGAIALGAIVSWTVIRPVRRIDDALDSLASGDFTTRIDVPNRDEFGTLSENVNKASEKLETLYATLETVNRDLQTKVEEQVAELEQASVLRRYLSPQIAEAIVEGKQGIGESRRAELSIVFVDIRGFTALSEQSEPEEMIANLNQFLTIMTDTVFKHEGTLDKYIGDALMVFFNDPLPQEDHATRAVRMALDMQKDMVDLRVHLAETAQMELTAGIGIATGFVTVGNIGSPSRMDYTAMGNHVNLASRLADDAAPGEILITDRTLALLPPGTVEAEAAGERNLKGVTRPISFYRVT